ncbi:hypothetical protein FSP39_019671, partial [Pinctada imbricata]
INASNWPSQLIMQFIPQSLLTSTQLQPRFKNSRQVAFHFGSHNLEALKNLYKVMGTGFAGCVHFPSPSQCDVRVLLLLFSNNRRAFIGLIPNDQTGFVQGMRTAIYSYKIEVSFIDFFFIFKNKQVYYSGIQRNFTPESNLLYIAYTSLRHSIFFMHTWKILCYNYYASDFFFGGGGGGGGVSTLFNLTFIIKKTFNEELGDIIYEFQILRFLLAEFDKTWHRSP